MNTEAQNKEEGPAADGVGVAESPESGSLKSEAVSDFAGAAQADVTASGVDESLPPLTLDRTAPIQMYPSLVAALSVLIVAILQVITNYRVLFQPHMWQNLCYIWIFYYVVFKAITYITVMPPKWRARLFGPGANNGLSLTLTQEGLEWHVAGNAKGQNVLPWSSVHFVAVQTFPKNAFRKSPQACLVLNCDKMQDYLIVLSELKSSNFEQLFRWFSRKVPQTKLSPEALYLQLQCLYGNQTPNIDSFTQIWSEEFDRRFELANHVCLSPGQQCGNGRYKVEMLIATRINSSVYVVTDQNGKRTILKELVVPVGAEPALVAAEDGATSARQQEKMAEQFEREVKLLSQIEHESIVKVRDHFVENSRTYLVLDCVQGNNLRMHVKLHGTLSESNVIDIAKQATDVLIYLHSLTPPIVHRDLTPDNIVFDESTQRIVVVDFGAANVYATQGTGTLIGKQGYMPPEQFKGKAVPASDIYALASTLSYLLTGQDPLGMGRIPSSIDSHKSELLQLIAACMDLDATRRPTAEALREQLTNLASSKKDPS